MCCVVPSPALPPTGLQHCLQGFYWAVLQGLGKTAVPWGSCHPEPFSWCLTPVTHHGPSKGCQKPRGSQQELGLILLGEIQVCSAQMSGVGSEEPVFLTVTAHAPP